MPVPTRPRPRLRARALGLALTLGLGSACATGPARVRLGPDELEGGSSFTPAVFVESGGIAAGDGTGPLFPCPVELGAAPAHFFADQISIRLPSGVAGEHVHQHSSRFARSDRPVAMGCEPGLSASVFIASVLFERSLENPGVEQAMARLFRDLNFPDRHEIVVLRGSGRQGDVTLSIAFPDHEAWGDTRGILRLVEAYGQVHAVGFLAEGEDYARLEPLFRASTKSMRRVPD